MWTAWRNDGRGGKLTHPLPAGLWPRIRADYAAMPVPRNLPWNGGGDQRGVFDVDGDRAASAAVKGCR